MKKRNIGMTIGMIILTTGLAAGCGSTGNSGASNTTGTTNTTNSTNMSNGTNTTATNNNTNTATGATSPSNVIASKTSPVGSGTSKVTKVGSASATTPSKAASKSGFPTIVKMAMSHLSSDVLTGAEAPTMWPMPATGSDTLYFKTYQSTTPMMGVAPYKSLYDVSFNDGHNEVASYSGTRYASTTDANNGFVEFFGNAFKSGTGKIQLDHAHTGTVTHDNNSTIISWSEGRWKIRVTDENSQTEPTKEANEVVDFLQSKFMPVPHNHAAILVYVNGSHINVQTMWQNANLLYSVGTNEHAKNPVTTALTMAIAMKQYK